MSDSSASRTIAVTGATGFVGRYVVRELLRHDVQVRALSRSGGGETDERLSWVVGDMRSEADLRTLVEGASAVVHLAYEHVPGHYRNGEGDNIAAWLDANLMGSLRLLEAAKDAKVARFIFLSSRAVFSHTDRGRLLDETHPVSPDSHYGAYKAAVEAFLSSYRAYHGLNTYAVRATGVYGIAHPVERSKWWNVIGDTLDGIAISTGGGTEVYAGDVANAVWALIDKPQISHHTFHLSDLYVAHRDVSRIVDQTIGITPDKVTSAAFIANNPLECQAIAELGVRFGGRLRLEQTIRELVDRMIEVRSHSGQLGLLVE